MSDLLDEYLTHYNGGRASYSPAVNISENEKSFLLEFSAPGFSKENFKVEAEDGTLSVSYEKEEEKTPASSPDREEKKNYSRREFRYGSFKRSFTMPENINAESIAARYENGILMVELPKKEVKSESKVKQVVVS